MTLIEARSLFREKLLFKFPVNQIDFIFKYILKEFFDWESTIIGLKPNLILKNFQLKKLEKAMISLLDDYPLQYITGKTFFMELEIIVNPNVLIPRPETEELTKLIISKCYNQTTFMDLCTGSGCIALAIKKHIPKSNVYGIDISSKSISLAKQNSKYLNLPVSLHNDNICKLITWPFKFDVIVSNPPYLDSNDIKNISPNVFKHEPHIALFAPPNNPIYFYECCISFAKNNLRRDGILYFEINPRHVNKIESLFLKSDFKQVEIKKDTFGKKRMLSAKKK